LAGAGSPTDAKGWAAYAAVRAPATAAAAARAVGLAVEALQPGWVPRTALDVGSGTGSTAAAVLTRWPATSVTCLERAAAARAVGQARVPVASWVAGDVRTAGLRTADLVTAGYSLGELAEADLAAVTDRLWAATGGLLLVLEPGTPRGFATVLAVRDRLLAAGGAVASPCPHEHACPLAAAGDWCHSAVRVARSAEHRSAKGADLGWEDEKLAYVALTRLPVRRREARIVRRPVYAPRLVTLQLCGADGRASTERIGRASPSYRAARDARWGDAWGPVDP